MGRERVLLVKGRAEGREPILRGLAQEGFEGVGVPSWQAALDVLRGAEFDAILRDRALPDIDGIEACRRLRKNDPFAHVPILLLMGPAIEEDRLAGLEAGLDDCLTEPFSLRELSARVRARLRRAACRVPDSEVYRIGPLTLDVGRHQVLLYGRPVRLTGLEFRILRFLARRPGYVFPRAEIIEGALEGKVDAWSRTVDVHVAALRRKLGPGGRMIETVRGVGYRLAEGR